MTITDHQLKGNWAEQFIASELSSQGCFVRHVDQGHDTGLDLYCELIRDGEPYLHFWCQIKTSKRWKGNHKSITYPDGKNQSDYWQKQPVPVFLFLVPDNRVSLSVPYYICSVIDFHLEKRFRSRWRINNRTDLDSFLLDLPLESYRWDLLNGKVGYLKTPRPQYVKKMPIGYSLPFKKRISRTILDSLFRLAGDHLERTSEQRVYLDEMLEATEPYILALKTLAYAIDQSHYHFYEGIGDYYSLKQEFKEALLHYRKSLEILNRDPHDVWGKNKIRLAEKIEDASENKFCRGFQLYFTASDFELSSRPF